MPNLDLVLGGGLLRGSLAIAIGPPGSGLTLLRSEPVELNPDVIADRLLLLIERTGARRLMIDSVLEIVRAVSEMAQRERVHNYLAALLAALCQHGVTTPFITEASVTRTTGSGPHRAIDLHPRGERTAVAAGALSAATPPDRQRAQDALLRV